MSLDHAELEADHAEPEADHAEPEAAGRLRRAELEAGMLRRMEEHPLTLGSDTWGPCGCSDCRRARRTRRKR